MYTELNGVLMIELNLLKSW